MNVEIGDEAALFPEKEYISGIFVAVHAIHSPFFSRLLIIQKKSPKQENSSPFMKHIL